MLPYLEIIPNSQSLESLVKEDGACAIIEPQEYFPSYSLKPIYSNHQEIFKISCLSLFICKTYILQLFIKIHFLLFLIF